MNSKQKPYYILIFCCVLMVTYYVGKQFLFKDPSSSSFITEVDKDHKKSADLKEKITQYKDQQILKVPNNLSHFPSGKKNLITLKSNPTPQKKRILIGINQEEFENLKTDLIWKNKINSQWKKRFFRHITQNLVHRDKSQVKIYHEDSFLYVNKNGEALNLEKVIVVFPPPSQGDPLKRKGSSSFVTMVNSETGKTHGPRWNRTIAH